MPHYKTEWFDSLVAEAGSVLSENPSISTDEACQRLESSVPEQLTFRQLTGSAGRYLIKNFITRTPQCHTRQQFTLAVLACLLLPYRIRPEHDTTSASENSSENEDNEDSLPLTKRLVRSIARAISPVLPKPNQHGNPDDLNDSSVSQQIRADHTAQCLVAADAAFRIFELLASRDPEIIDNTDVLLTLIAYTNPGEEWTTPDLAARAALLLKQHFNSTEKSTSHSKQDFITITILPSYLRPLFSKSSPQSSITPSGRPSAYGPNPDARPSGIPDDSSVTKPWKFVDLRAVTVFEWAVSEADEETTITKSWPLFIPVLLTLADDNSTYVRKRGLVILRKFLDKFPSRILSDTGLNKVFEDTVLPTLSYLPSITPEEESVELLGPAYAALRCLAGKLFGEGKKNKLLDRVVREGILLGYFHAKEHVRIVEVLCRELGDMLVGMGIDAVRHLKDIIPMLSTILTDPFASLHQPTLLSAIRALQAVLATCWPRVPNSPWQDEIINSLVLCWLNLGTSGTSNNFAVIRQALVHTADALAAVLATEVEEGKPTINLSEVVAPLVAKEPSLSQLFSTTASNKEGQDLGLES